MISFGKSDKGRKRNINEDSYYFDSDRGVFIVADGMGGHLAGEEASKIAVDTISKFLINASSNIESIIEKSITTTNNLIHSKSEMDQKFKGMGTTLTCAVFRNKKLFVGHVGDSRLYQFRDYTLHLLTDDHSKVWEFYKEGIITKDEARTHPYKNVITRAVGIKPEVHIDIFSVNSLMVGDMYLICSDGLNDMLNDDQITDILSLGETGIEQKVDLLIEQANKNGGKDNITVILFMMEKIDLMREEDSDLLEHIKTRDYVLFNKSINFTIKTEIITTG